MAHMMLTFTGSYDKKGRPIHVFFCYKQAVQSVNVILIEANKTEYWMLNKNISFFEWCQK